jgi:Ca2+-binding RTX toxin-like protein
VVRSGEVYTGTDAAEKILGSDGKDIIDGAAGDDLLSGGQGGDSLTGGLGSDTFAWTLADQGTSALPARDTITDFDIASKAAGGDVLDLHDLLPNAGTDAGSLDIYLNFSKQGSDTVIDVKPDGPNVTQKIVLEGVDLVSTGGSDVDIISDLISKGKLITD